MFRILGKIRRRLLAGWRSMGSGDRLLQVVAGILLFAYAPIASIGYGAIMVVPAVFGLLCLRRPRQWWFSIVRSKLPFIGFLLLFFAYAVLVASLSSSHKVWNHTLPYLPYILFLYPTILLIWRKIPPGRFARLFLWGYVLALLLVIADKVASDFLPVAFVQNLLSGSSPRSYFEAKDAFLGFGLFSFVALGLLDKEARYPWPLLFYIFVLFVSYLAPGQSSFSAVLFGGSAYFLAKHWKKFTFWLFFAGIWLLPLFPFFAPSFYHVAMRFPLLAFADRDRIEIWAMTSRQIVAAWHEPLGWLGRGFGSTRDLLHFDLWASRLTPFAGILRDSGNLSQPHNYVLLLLFELGPLGLFFFNLLLTFLIVAVHRSTRFVRAAAYAGLIVYMFPVSTILGLWGYHLFLTAAFGFPIALRLLCSKHNQTPMRNDKKSTI